MRCHPAFVAVFAALVVLAPSARAGTTLVLPLRSVGVDALSVSVARDLLAGELRDRGWPVVSLSDDVAATVAADQACAEPRCASQLAAAAGAERVVYGSVSRLGEKVIVRVEALRVGEEAPAYSEQFSENAVEDLDRVMARAAEAMVAGRARADRPTVDTVIRSENEEPLRRASRKGIGFRAGILFPVADGYSGENQLTSLQMMWSKETRDFLVETCPFTGVAWSDNAHEWVLFNLFVAKILSRGDWAPYVGGGFGLHRVWIRTPVSYGFEPEYVYYDDVGKTVFALDGGVGLLALRTYDFTLNLELRYHHTFRDEGDGAQGFWLTVGTGR